MTDKDQSQSNGSPEPEEKQPAAPEEPEVEGSTEDGKKEIPVPESESLGRHLTSALRLLGVTVLLCSVAYPAAVTVVGQILWKGHASGGIVEHEGRPVGARLIGQQFSSDAFFHPRPSSTNYDAMDSGSANLGPLNEALTERVEGQLEKLREEGIDPAEVPAGWVSESGSALDPHISPAAARLQVPRVARARGMDSATLEQMIRKHTRGKFVGLFGHARVNVLLLNLEIEKRTGSPE